MKLYMLETSVYGTILYIIGPFYPTLKLLHKYPTMMNKIQVDKGAIRFILGGANIMCPGITSKGGKIFEPLDAEEPVAIYAEVQIKNLLRKRK